MLKLASAIIIDEAPMLHKDIYETINRILYDFRENIDVMGGIPTLTCGDFR